MSKRWSKQKAGKQVSKKRKAGGPPGGGDMTKVGGTLGGIRGMTRGFFSGSSGKPKTTTAKIIDWALWVAVIVVGYTVVQSRCNV